MRQVIHQVISLNTTKLKDVFLPLNVTSVIQLVEQEIIVLFEKG